MKYSVMITKPGHKNDGKWWSQDGGEPVGVLNAGKWEEEYLSSCARGYEAEGKVRIVPSRDRFHFDLDMKHLPNLGEFKKGVWRNASTSVSLRDYTSDERKTMPIAGGVFNYFPDGLAAVSRVSNKGNIKHNGPNAPLGWSRGKSNDHLNCVARHILTPDAIDPDSGEIELAHAAWRILAALQLAEEKRLVAAGIKPLSGVTQ